MAQSEASKMIKRINAQMLAYAKQGLSLTSQYKQATKSLSKIVGGENVYVIPERVSKSGKVIPEHVAIRNTKATMEKSSRLNKFESQTKGDVTRVKNLMIERIGKESYKALKPAEKKEALSQYSKVYSEFSERGSDIIASLYSAKSGGDFALGELSDEYEEIIQELRESHGQASYELMNRILEITDTSVSAEKTGAYKKWKQNAKLAEGFYGHSL